MRTIDIVAIGGGPCGGKSSLMAHASARLLEYGIQPVILSETATELINGGITPAMLGFAEFERQLTGYLLERENRYKKIAMRVRHKRVVILADRGALDAEGYMGEQEFARMLVRMKHTRAALLARYRMALHMVTAADGAEEYYTLENNAARTETPEQARELDRKTRHAWRGHPHFVVIDNSTDFKGKINRALSALSRVLPMPAPLETERRFLIRNFDPSFIPDGAAKVDIVQTYLVPPAEGERRLRAATLDGATIYYRTVKTPTDHPGKNHEDEKVISEREYRELLAEADPSRRPIWKTRYRFPRGQWQFEVDVYTSEPHKSRGLVKLEVEVPTLDTPVDIPAGWDVLEVTDDPAYLNSNLARAA